MPDCFSRSFLLLIGEMMQRGGLPQNNTYIGQIK